MKNCLVFGAGGHSRVVVDILERSADWKIYAIITNDTSSSNHPYPVKNESLEILKKIPYGIVAIGDNWTRHKVVKNILTQCPDFKFISAIHQSAIIPKTVSIGNGSVIAAGVVINPYSKIEEHCIINTNATIEHDNKIGNFSSIAPGAILGGNVEIGDFSAIGIGAILQHNISIGNHTIIGSGSVVTTNQKDNTLAFGAPCKFIRHRENGDKYL